jgi:hypothetical protein
LHGVRLLIVAACAASSPARALMLLGIIAGIHAAVGLLLRLYFFHYRGAPEVAGSG